MRDRPGKRAGWGWLGVVAGAMGGLLIGLGLYDLTTTDSDGSGVAQIFTGIVIFVSGAVLAWANL